VPVTGGAGYIGSHTVHDLVDAGKRVRVLDNLSTGFASAWTPEFDNLDAIVRHALAWERRLMAQGERSDRQAISA
jgi:UDP-glucose 4-epimerase